MTKEDDDPIFAAIEAHKTWMERVREDWQRNWDDWHAGRPRQPDHEGEALLALLNTMPTTPHGMAALLAYMGQMPLDEWPDVPDKLT